MGAALRIRCPLVAALLCRDEMAAGDSAMPAGEDHTEDSVAGGGGQWRMLSGISIFDVPMARRRQTAVSVL